MSAAAPPRSPRALLVLAYAASGFAGLVYQVTWARHLALVLGHSTGATSAAVAGVMGGLGGGALIAGPAAARLSPRQALRAYAAAEGLVLAGAAMLPWLLDSLTPLLQAVYGDAPGALFGAVRIAAVLGLVLLPSLALGASFPLAVRAAEGSTAGMRDWSGTLYAVNTAAAAAGACLAGFVLVPSLGTRPTAYVGLACTALAIACALAAAGRADMAAPEAGGAPDTAKAPPASPSGRDTTATPTPSPRHGRRRSTRGTGSSRRADAPSAGPGLALVVLALTGFASVVYEIAWSRILALLLGPTTYAFAAALATVVAGLGAGAIGGAWLLARRLPHATIAGAALLAGALVVPLAAAQAGGPWPARVADALASTPAISTALLARHLTEILLLLLPPLVALGVAFPLTLSLSGRPDAGASRRAGLAYGINTLASVVGALAAAWLLVPVLGLRLTLLGVAVLIGAAGLLLVVPASGARTRLFATATAAGVAALCAWSPAWDTEVLASGVYKAGGSGPLSAGREAARAGRLVYYREGPAGTVSVKRLTGNLSLAIDGKVDASDAGDMPTQALLAHLPLALHPHPSTALVIGLGSGVTAAAALSHPIERLDIAELSPEVVEASRVFARPGQHPLDHPRTRLVQGDGRSHLLLGRTRYDVIVSEPSNPWMAGVAALFTQEFFGAARARLTPGGVMCQWAHTYDISRDDFRSIVATFLSVFPEGTLWQIGTGDVLLVGTDGPLDERLQHLDRVFTRETAATDLRRIGVEDAVDLATLFVAGGAPLSAAVRGVPLQSDDRLALEFSGPRALNAATGADVGAWVRQQRDRHPPPPAIAAARRAMRGAHARHLGTLLQHAGDLDGAYAAFAAALDDAPDVAALDGYLRAAMAAGDAETAVARLRAAMAADPRAVPIRLALSRFLAALGQGDEALALAADTVRLAPDDARAVEALAELSAGAGDLSGLTQAVAVLQRVAPAQARLPYFAAVVHRLAGRPGEARAALADAAQRTPDDAAVHNLDGILAIEAGARDQARARFLAAQRAAPRDVDAYLNLGLLELEAGARDEAREWFREALSLDPASTAAREGLARTGPAPD